MQKAIDTFNSIGNFNNIFRNLTKTENADKDEFGDEKQKEYVNSKTMIFLSQEDLSSYKKSTDKTEQKESFKTLVS